MPAETTAGDTEATTVETTRRGRPLDATREAAILRATAQLLEERGYDQLTVREIAERACAGLGAIYRRWPTKDDLVLATLESPEYEWSVTAPPTGDVETDLAETLLHHVHSIARVAPGFLGSMRFDSCFALSLRERIVGPLQERIDALLAGEFPDPVERALRTEVAMAVPLHRMLTGGTAPDDEEIRTRLVPLILGRPMTTPAPVTRGRRRARRRPAPPG